MLDFPLYKKLAIFAVILWATFQALPNVLPESAVLKLPDSLPKNTLNLGLDLQGGSHLVLEVDVDDVVKRAYENLEDEVRLELRDERLNYRSLSAKKDKVTFNGFKQEQHEQIRDVLIAEIRDIELEQDGSIFSVTFTDQALESMVQSALTQTLEILRSRVDEFGVAEPLIQREGDRRVIIELPGIDDVARAKGIIGRTAQLTFHMVDDNADPYRTPPPGTDIFYEHSKRPDGSEIKIPYVLTKRPAITGELLSGASSDFTQYGEAAVQVKFDARGTRKFAKLTTEYTGRRMAIVLDGVVYSAPVLREPILGGVAQITGSFTPQEAEDLATVLRAGALPAPVEVVEERTIGPSLGQDSIEASKKAIVYGFLAVMLMMGLLYGFAGTVANVALLVNVILIAGIMTAFGATLTLPGIAGILLTIGMAVDANVLIFERIREEAARGRSALNTLDAGFKSAFTTILDANITTLIAAVILFSMGSGPIRGFALTLSVGVLSSMFTAIMLTRLMLVSWVKYKRPRKFTV